MVDDVKSREQLGFVCVAVFVVVASLRDVYFATTLQAYSPLHVAAIAFTLCTLVFLSAALVRRQGLRERRPWLWEVVGINVTSAIAWIAYFYALKHLEPSLVQVLWAGIGPLSVGWLEAGGVVLARPVLVAPQNDCFTGASSSRSFWRLWSLPLVYRERHLSRAEDPSLGPFWPSSVGSAFRSTCFFASASTSAGSAR